MLCRSPGKHALLKKKTESQLGHCSGADVHVSRGLSVIFSGWTSFHLAIDSQGVHIGEQCVNMRIFAFIPHIVCPSPRHPPATHHPATQRPTTQRRMNSRNTALQRNTGCLAVYGRLHVKPIHNEGTRVVFCASAPQRCKHAKI